jgi:DNA repair protein SbcC/Rad50
MVLNPGSSSDTPKLEQAFSEARKLEEVRRDEMMKTEVALRELLGPTVPEDHAIEIGPLRAVLENETERHESRLGELARMRRDLAGAGDQVREALASDEVAEQVQAEQASSVAREALERWRATSGTELNVIVAAAQKRFPSVISAEADPAASQAMATAAVRAALERTQNALVNDDAIVQSLAEVQISIRQGQGRIEQIDAELVSAGGANRALAEALTAIASHIEDELCPVCGRDFAEVSATPLAAHVSEEVARLVAAAGRVEALVRDRTTTSTAVVAAERREADFLARRLPKERRDQLILERAELTEWMNSLEVLADRATTGTRLLREATQAAQRLSVLNSRQSSISGLRAELAVHGEQLSLRPFPADLPLQQIVSELLSEVRRLSARESELKQNGDRAIQTLGTLEERRRKAEDAAAQLTRAAGRKQLVASRRQEAERRIALAKDLLARAQAIRADEVRRVFNEELNAIWRELFVRLAPDEAFVPAFALPSVPGRLIEAVLETHYRSGGKGGNPRAMLSAGNLNTAALTLFLGLHLSVAPILPWLVLDDPVQSMDDVHIAQFAALLRTLKQHGRQVVIAVHDRQLFDYLTLELSPTINGDRLITIELGRDSDGMTTAPWSLMAFQPDRAIAA